MMAALLLALPTVAMSLIKSEIRIYEGCGRPFSDCFKSEITELSFEMSAFMTSFRRLMVFLTGTLFLTGHRSE